MTNAQLFEFIVYGGLILLGGYAIYREQDLARLERKAWRYIKAFFKALYYTAAEKLQK